MLRVLGGGGVFFVLWLGRRELNRFGAYGEFRFRLDRGGVLFLTGGGGSCERRFVRSWIGSRR